MHILTSIGFLSTCNVTHCSCIDFMFRSQLVLCVFCWLLLFRFFRLLPKASKILFRLTWILLILFLFSSNGWLLTICLWLTFWVSLLVLLSFLPFFRFLLILLWLIFWRHWIEDPWRL